MAKRTKRKIETVSLVTGPTLEELDDRVTALERYFRDSDEQKARERQYERGEALRFAVEYAAGGNYSPDDVVKAADLFLVYLRAADVEDGGKV